MASLAVACALVLAALASTTSCAPAVVPQNGTSPLAAVGDVCPIEPDSLVLLDVGDIPLVLTSTHAGETVPLGCSEGESALRAIEDRVCEAGGDAACASGPCRAGAGDRGARLLTFALVEELAKCMGGRPHLALSEMRRTMVDMNRDAHDPGGMSCALDDAAALPYWEAYHRSVESAVALASAQAEQRGEGKRALLVDLHTYATLPAAPPPAVMIGTGIPFGTTVPHLAAADPTLAAIFGDNGLRARLLANLAPIADEAEPDGTLQVLPASKDASLDGLFAGRYIVHRYARLVPGETQGAGPAVDAIQLELSAGLRDDAIATAEAIAHALCATFAERIGAPGARP